MNIIPYALRTNQWIHQITAKKYVVWHGTAGRTLHTPSSGRPGRMHSTAAGQASGALTSIDGWNLDALRVGVPYLRASFTAPSAMGVEPQQRIPVGSERLGDRLAIRPLHGEYNDAPNRSPNAIQARVRS